jgi:hypothetical protein
VTSSITSGTVVANAATAKRTRDLRETILMLD